MDTIEKSLENAKTKANQGHRKLAIQICEQILKDSPGDLETSLFLGSLYGAENNHKKASDVFKKSLKYNPNISALYYNVGLTQQNLNDLDNALQSYIKAFEIDQNHFNSLLNAGSILQSKHEWQAAIEYYDKAIKVNPKFKEALNNRALCLLDLNRTNEALECIMKALVIDPNYADAYSTRGVILQRLKRFDDAATNYNMAIRHNPNNYTYRANLGNCYDELGKFEESLEAYQIAVRLAPDKPEAHYDLGVSLTRMKRYAEAQREFQDAIKISPNYPSAHFQLGIHYLTMGQLKEGFEEYEWRLKIREFSETFLSENRWDGKINPDQSVLVRSEQGLGDTIHFMRLLPYLKQKGVRVVFEYQDRIKPLLDGVEGYDDIIGRDENNVPQNVPDIPQIPLLSLPSYFGIELNNIPCDIPYVHPSTELVSKWREKIEKAKTEKEYRLVVGINWAGRPTHKNDVNRSVTLAQFAPLSIVKDILFVSLQKGEAAYQSLNPPEGMNFVDLAVDINDFADAAAVIENCDLLISVDTSLVHLAGAIGKPVWTLLPADPDWRWMLNRDDSPWYPTMRLFRQEKLREWTPVFDSVTKELEEYANSPVEWHIEQANIRYTLGHKVQSIVELMNISRYYPQRTDILNTLANLFWQSDDLESSVSAVTKAYRINPNDRDTVINCANIMLTFGRFEDSIFVCKHYLEDNQNDEEVVQILKQAESESETLAA